MQAEEVLSFQCKCKCNCIQSFVERRLQDDQWPFLHVSRGILVTCETLLTFSMAYDSSFDRGFAARNKKVLRLFNDASISKMIIATAWVFSQDLGFFEAILGSWFFSEGLGFFLGFS